MTNQLLHLRLKRITKNYILLCAIWSCLVFLSGLFYAWVENQEINKSALTEARASFNRDLLFRRWAAGHGGVYAPVTEKNQPNPYLSHLPERDITTPSGRSLTLINPAYMTRQVHELSDELGGSQGHITSLQPLNPINAPDDWERKALELIALGEAEVVSVELFRGEKHLRYMRRMVAEKPCLGCHAIQGYKEGDVRGGISVSVPLAPYYLVSSASIRKISLGHLGIWLAGLISSFFLGYRIILRQVESRSEIEAKLLQSQKMEAVGTMAGGIAHDFNNILSIIIGYADIVKNEVPDNKQIRDDIDTILTAAKRATDLITQLLSFSRQAEQQLITIQPYSIVNESLKLLRSIIPRTVEIKTNLDPFVGTVLSDPTKIHQVLMNLCTNAVHAMDEKGIIEVKLERVELADSDIPPGKDLPAGPYMKLEVADNGTGMDDETRQKIFAPFFTTKERGKGTGMGLSVIHGIAESHRGFITVDSELGRGSTFSLFLPVSNVADDVPDKTTIPKETAGRPLGNEKILFIDDEILLGRWITRMLEQYGYQVTSYTDSIEAFEAFRADPEGFDLIITDQSMPQLSGLELSAEVFKIRPDLPIILCSGYSSKIPEGDFKELGISEFVRKPFNKEKLADIIRKVLGKKV